MASSFAWQRFITGRHGKLLEVGVNDEEIERESHDNIIDLESDHRKVHDTVQAYVITREIAGPITNVGDATSGVRIERVVEHRPHHLVYARDMLEAIQTCDAEFGARIWIPQSVEMRQISQMGFDRVNGSDVFRIYCISKDSIVSARQATFVPPAPRRKPRKPDLAAV